MEAAAEKFRTALAGKDAAVVKELLTILGKHFVTDDKTEGYRKDGPVAVTHSKSKRTVAREQRSLRQREASDVVTTFIAACG